MNNQTVRDCTLNQVALQFDWQPPIDGQVTFQSHVARLGRTSAVDFTIDLNRLTKPDLERLHTFLSRRSSGLASPYETTRNLDWLLQASLGPGLTRIERQRKVRELLLVDAELQNATSAGKEVEK
jgi:hypothetical protein